MKDIPVTEIFNLSFNAVKSSLKLSKTPPNDNGPYYAKWDSAGWWNIYDSGNALVGQTSKPLDWWP